MNDICGDNRFEIIAKAKEDILKRTNIHTNEDEMKVLDDFLFRCWQMRWLDKYDEIDEFKEGDKCANNHPKSSYINDRSIIEEAKKYYKDDIKCYDAFLHGVEFKENNQWISVEDDLPKVGADGWSYPVLAYAGDCCIPIVARFSDGTNMEEHTFKVGRKKVVTHWFGVNPISPIKMIITHWMYFPKLPELPNHDDKH